MSKFKSSDFSWIELRASLDSLEPFRHFVLEKAGELGVSPEVFPNLEVALEELLVNVINYAYPPEEPGTIRLGCGSFDGGLFCIQVRDSGKPFDPLGLPDPDLTLDIMERPVGGLGIYLVRHLARSVHYEYADGSNRLTCCFALKAATDCVST